MALVFNEVPCIKCGVSDRLWVDVATCSFFECENCKQQFEIELIEQILATYGPLIAWIRSAPEFARATSKDT